MPNQFVTEDKLKQILKANNDDLIDRFIEYADKNLASKTELEEVKTAIKHLPTKQEFSRRMDKLSGEYQTFSQEAAVITKKLPEIEDRLEVIETQLNISPAI